jgi:superfamily I DNA/RNA helicase
VLLSGEQVSQESSATWWALIELSAGLTIADVEDKYQLRRPEQELALPAATEDEALMRGLQRPAAQISFTYIEGSEELRRVIEGGDFGAWRVFLHPEQRAYARRPYQGAFRLSGGAGTGKTVVVLHRARTLALRDPRARVLVTTFTTNLADAMRADLARLDPKLPRAGMLGESGIQVAGIDALAGAVLRAAPADLDEDVQAVLGAAGAQTLGRMVANPWREALEAAGGALPSALRSEAFLSTEYATVILPNRITARQEYLRVRRPGRGVALDRARRSAVWDVVAACRAQARVRGGVDFVEAPAIAATHLSRRAVTDGYLFDHVLVDEGQDLSPTHWQLLRALVGDHADDLFIAEDSHQRIYGRRVVLSQFGIRIVGRSRRLTLNYRTTAQALDYAMRILQGGTYVDLEAGVDVSADYRSARSGPPVRRIACTTLAQELDQAAAVVGEWAAGSGVAPETVAVLVRDRWQRDRVAAGFAERGVPIRSVDREHLKPGQPVVMTMHRAKGTEFSRVLLFGISDGSVPAALRDQRYCEDAWEDAMLRERSLVYVAATRARDELAITSSGKPSSLVAKAGS